MSSASRNTLDDMIGSMRHPKTLPERSEAAVHQVFSARVATPCGAAEKVNYRGLVMPSALTPSPAGRSPHRARCARAGTAERCLRRLSAKKYELLDIEKMLSQAAFCPV